MRNKFSSNRLSNQTGEIWCYDLHSALKIALNFTTELEHSEGLLAEILKTFYIEVTDFLSHRGFHGLSDSLSNLTISSELFDLLETGSAVGSVSDESDELHENVVIRYDSCELREMPRVPFLDSHGESVNVLIE
mgnify:FL=1